MVQGYYSLDEAARILGMDADKLSQMAQRREIRAFADRGTWRFRTQDVEEMARRLGMGSNPDLQLGEGTPKPPTPSAARGAPDEVIIDFSGGAAKDAPAAEHDIVIDSPSSSKIRKAPVSKTPTPKPQSDSDVHLVFDVSDEIPIIHDSDVKLEDSGPKSAKQRKPDSSTTRKKTGTAPSSDSGVRLVPMEEEPPIPLAPRPTPSDSDIRVEPSYGRGKGPSDTSLTTEEINLDEEMRRSAEAARAEKSGPKVKGKSDVKTSGPETPPTAAKSGTGPKTPVRKEPTAARPRQPADDEEVSLGSLEEPSELSGAGHLSGINLSSPADSGINLGKPGSSDDSLEFELSLEPEATPKPTEKVSEEDSSGEFELTLDEGSALAPLEEEAAASGEKDIFETDFDMPALDEESGSEAVALEEEDTDAASSDFDLSLGDDESGSQVVALEEEEADEGAATVARGTPRRAAALEDEGDIDELLAEDVVDEEEEEIEAAPRRTAVAAAAPANWGVLPGAMLIPCVLVMCVLSFMSFELLHNMWGYKQPYKTTGIIVKTISGWFSEKLPD
jgi:excisionase family DNA binding protein